MTINEVCTLVVFYYFVAMHSRICILFSFALKCTNLYMVLWDYVSAKRSSPLMALFASSDRSVTDSHLYVVGANADCVPQLFSLWFLYLTACLSRTIYSHIIT